MTSSLLTGFLLASSASLLWVFLDAARKRLGQEQSAAAVVSGICLFQLPTLAVWLLAGGFLHTPGGLFPSLALPQPSFWGWWLVGLPLHVLSNLLFLRAVQLSPLSLTIPYLSFTPVFSAVLGIWMLGELPTLSGWCGIGVVCLGAFFLNPGQEGDGLFAPIRALWTERGSLLMLGVALLWSLTPILDKKATLSANIPTYLFFLNAGVGLAFVLLRSREEGGTAALWREWSKARPLLLAAAFVAVLAMLCQLSSYHYLPVSTMETIKRGFGLIGAVVAGAFLFGEGHSLRRLLSVLVMLAGIGILLLGG